MHRGLGIGQKHSENKMYTIKEKLHVRKDARYRNKWFKKKKMSNLTDLNYHKND